MGPWSQGPGPTPRGPRGDPSPDETDAIRATTRMLELASMQVASMGATTLSYKDFDADFLASETEARIAVIEKENIEKINEIVESSNIIEDVSYSARDTKGNEYFLKASEGTIDRSESNYIFLKLALAMVHDLYNEL